MAIENQERKEKEVMAAAGETSDGSVRTNDYATKSLLNDISNEETIKSAESFSTPAPAEETHMSIDNEILGDNHFGYRRHLKNLVDDTEADSTLQHLESPPVIQEEQEDHTFGKSSMHSMMSDTVMDQHLSYIENPPQESSTEEHTYGKSHMLNLMSGTEIDANLDSLENHRPPEASFLQTEAEVESGVEA